MAQVTGGANFDDVWEEWANTALILLREAAGLFAGSSKNALDHRVVVASFLAVVSRPRPADLYVRPKWPLRFFDGSQEPCTSAKSLAKLGGSIDAQRTTELEHALTRVTAEAAAAWRLGDPERPDPRDVLRELFEILWSERLIPHPPSKAFPRGI